MYIKKRKRGEGKFSMHIENLLLIPGKINGVTAGVFQSFRIDY
jgi:hypothetical protein